MLSEGFPPLLWMDLERNTVVVTNRPPIGQQIKDQTEVGRNQPKVT